MYLTFSMFFENFLEFTKNFLEFLAFCENHRICHTTTSLPPWTAEWILHKMQEILLWHTKQAPFHFQINFQYETSSWKHGPLSRPGRQAGCGVADPVIFTKCKKLHEILRNSEKFFEILGNF